MTRVYEPTSPTYSAPTDESLIADAIEALPQTGDRHHTIVQLDGETISLSVARAPADEDCWLWFSAAAAERAGFTSHWGRKVLEIRPPVRIDKGAGIINLLRDRDLAVALYVGDDTTDLDAFREATVRIAVRSAEGPPELIEQADAVVDGTDDVVAMLQALIPPGWEGK